MKGCRAIRSLGLVSLGVACAVGTRSTETNGGAAAVPARFGPAVAAVRRFILDTMRVLGAPGAAICVSQDGRLIWSEGFGFADLEQRVPVTTETRFRIGSVSKPLTAAALGLLSEAGKLDWDAPVQRYVPTFPVKRYPITVRQVAGHLAGIRHYRPGSSKTSGITRRWWTAWRSSRTIRCCSSRAPGSSTRATAGIC